MSLDPYMPGRGWAPNSGGLPRYAARSASALPFSRPAWRSLTLRPACSLGRPRRPVPSKAPTVSLPLPPLRLLPAGATPCRAGITPAEDTRLVTAHRANWAHSQRFPMLVCTPQKVLCRLHTCCPTRFTRSFHHDESDRRDGHVPKRRLEQFHATQCEHFRWFTKGGGEPHRGRSAATRR